MSIIFDAHCHIFPSKIAQKATDSIGSFYDIPMERVGSPEALLHEMDTSGIRKALVCSTATRSGQVHAINRFISDAEAAAGGRFLGFGTLHQDLTDEEMQDEIESFSSLGLHGVKLHPDFQSLPIDLPKMIPVYKELAKRKLPVLFHMGDDRYDFSAPERLANVAKEVPDLRAIAAHLGGYRVWERADCLVPFENIIYDCSSTLGLVSDEVVMRQFEKFGAGRILFGSDFPMWSPAGVLARLRALPLSQNDEELVLHGNFEKYFILGEWKA